MIVIESLVQVTLVAGPPVEMQMMLNLGVVPLRAGSIFIDKVVISIFPIKRELHVNHIQ